MKKKVLYVSQEIKPFLPETEISNISRTLPQKIQEKGKEIRVFMPRFGSISERRHQLHEVIRLSGMNLIIDDTDHPLIIKVASIPSARMQVYFIDNEEYFKRKSLFGDDKTPLFKDNDERAMFFSKGVLETVKKLGWTPDIIHCQGWMTSFMPIFVKKLYKDDPHFTDTKIVYSAYDGGFEGALDPKCAVKLQQDGLGEAETSLINDPTFVNLNKLGIQYSDGVIQGSETINDEIISFTQELEIPFLPHQGTEYVNAISDFYDNILADSSVLVD